MKSWNSFSNQLTEKKSPKDYDGDGVVETGSKEHAGAVHNAIQRAKGKKADGKDTRKEEVENIDETALGDKARSKAVEMGRKRRSTKEYKAGGARGTGKNERAAYNLANAQQSTNADLGSQKRTDTASGMRGHQNKSVKKTGSYDYGAVLDKKDPKKNPKHTANKKTTKEEVQQVEENIGNAVGGALERGANFMKRNPVGKTIRSVLKPVGSGAGTARPSVRTQDTIRKNQIEGYGVSPNRDPMIPKSHNERMREVGDRVKKQGVFLPPYIGPEPKRVKAKPTTQMAGYEPQGEMVVDEGKKELDREKRNKMFRRAGNLSREALKGGDKGTEAGRKSAKIVKAINKDNEGKDRNDVKNEAYTITNTDVKGNTPAYRNYKAGMKNKTTGKPLYGLAPHVKLADSVEPEEKLVTGRKMFTIPDEEKSAAAARLKEKARKKREEKMKEEVKVETPVVEEAESKSQQRLMGLALSVKKGDTPMSSVTPQVAKMAREMKEKDLKDFAGTKHDGLPEKVKSEEPKFSSPLVESLVESAAQRMAAKARREDAQTKRLDRQASSAQQRTGINAKK